MALARSLSYSDFDQTAFTVEDDKAAISAAVQICDPDISSLDELDGGMPPLARQTPGWLAWSCSTLTVEGFQHKLGSCIHQHTQENFGISKPAILEKQVPEREDNQAECSTPMSSYSDFDEAAFTAEDNKEVISGSVQICDIDVFSLDELDGGMPPLARQTPGWLTWSCASLTVEGFQGQPSSCISHGAQDTFSISKPAMFENKVPERKDFQIETCSTLCSMLDCEEATWQGNVIESAVTF